MSHPGPELKKSRLERGLSQRRLAELAEVSPTTVRQIERQEIAPHELTVAKLRRALSHVGADDTTTSLLQGSGSREVWDMLQGAAESVAAAERATLRGLVEKILRNHGVRPELPAPGEPEYDLAFTAPDGRRHLIEVKAVGDSSRGVWEGMGELLAYRTQLGGHDAVQGWLLIERTPSAEERDQLADLDLRIVSPDDWTPLDAELEATAVADDGTTEPTRRGT